MCTCATILDWQTCKRANVLARVFCWGFCSWLTNGWLCVLNDDSDLCVRAWVVTAVANVFVYLFACTIYGVRASPIGDGREWWEDKWRDSLWKKRKCPCPLADRHGKQPSMSSCIADAWITTSIYRLPSINRGDGAKHLKSAAIELMIHTHSKRHENVRANGIETRLKWKDECYVPITKSINPIVRVTINSIEMYKTNTKHLSGVRWFFTS